MLQHVSVCERAATPVAVDPLTSLLESPTHETTASPHREHQAYTKPAPMPKPMHAHTKHERPTAKRSAATTSLTNDQRNKPDHAMPVRAPSVHIHRRHVLSPAPARVPMLARRRAALYYPINPSHSCKPNLHCEPNLRRLADLICQADL